MRYMIWLLFYLKLCCGKESTEELCPKEDGRSKRQINTIPLVFPYGATYKLLVGMASPIPNRDHINMLFAINFQYQYLQFQNITELSQYYFIKEVSRQERDAELLKRRDERLMFYKSMAGMLEAEGMSGMDCVLRAICEVSQYPIEDQGMIGEIVHILLTPDYGKTPFDDVDPYWQESMQEFRDAATAGRQMFNCPSIYSGCPEGRGLLELISILRND